MDSQQQEELQVTVEQDIANLQKQIDELKRGKKDSPFTTAITINPFSTLGERKIEQGSTGSARYRKLPLIDHVTAMDHTTHVFTDHEHQHLINAGSVLYPSGFLPSDYVLGGLVKLRYMYAVSSTGNTDITVVVSSMTDKDTAVTVLLTQAQESISYPTQNVMTISKEYILTILPSPESKIQVKITRGGSDDNTGSIAIYAFWLEYLAHS